MTVLRSIRSYWVVFLLWCVLGASCGLGIVFMLARQPPVILLSLREVDGVAVRNGSLDMLFTLTRSRFCEPRVDRWVWQDSGMRDRLGHIVRRYVTLPAAASPPVPLGEEVTYILSIPLPSNVGPGDWFYWSRTYDGCNWFPFMQRPSRTSPDEPVHVSEGPAPGAKPSYEQLLPSTAQP